MRTPRGQRSEEGEGGESARMVDELGGEGERGQARKVQRGDGRRETAELWQRLHSFP